MSARYKLPKLLEALIKLPGHRLGTAEHDARRAKNLRQPLRSTVPREPCPQGQILPVLFQDRGRIKTMLLKLGPHAPQNLFPSFIKQRCKGTLHIWLPAVDVREAILLREVSRFQKRACSENNLRIGGQSRNRASHEVGGLGPGEERILFYRVAPIGLRHAIVLEHGFRPEKS